MTRRTSPDSGHAGWNLPRKPVARTCGGIAYGAPLGDQVQFPCPGEDLAILVRLVATGRLHAEIGRVADWADTAATLADLRERRIRGNAVLTMS